MGPLKQGERLAWQVDEPVSWMDHVTPYPTRHRDATSAEVVTRLLGERTPRPVCRDGPAGTRTAIS